MSNPLKEAKEIIEQDHSIKPTFNPKENDVVEKHIKVAAVRDLLSSMVRSKVIFEDFTISAFVAETPAQKAVGLEVADSLEEDEAMMFPFDYPSHQTFHMGAVKFPIDVVFLAKDPAGLRVQKIIHAAQPGTSDRWSCADTVAVLEFSGGICKKMGVNVGTICRNKINVSLKNDISIKE